MVKKEQEINKLSEITNNDNEIKVDNNNLRTKWQSKTESEDKSIFILENDKEGREYIEYLLFERYSDIFALLNCLQNPKQISSFLLLFPRNYLPFLFNKYYDKSNEPFKKAIHIAAERSHLLLKVIIDLGADINSPTKHHFRAIHFAVIANNYQSTKLLLQHGADPSLPLPNEVMHFASSIEIIRLLAKYKANLDPVALGTPLKLSIRASNKNIPKIIFLLQNYPHNFHDLDKILEMIEDREIVKIFILYSLERYHQSYSDTHQWKFNFLQSIHHQNEITDFFYSKPNFDLNFREKSV